MYFFKDFHNCNVRLTFDPIDCISTNPNHVWVVCRYLNQWLLTNHSTRGLEFPGGKVEEGERVNDAAKREVWEETGATIKSLHFIGQYEVRCECSSFQKAIYFAEISSLMGKETYLETNGPILIRELPVNIKEDDSFSFVMKDEVLPFTLKQLAKKQLI